MAQQNRDYLYGKFQQGAKPSEQDFRDLIDSTLNFQDDQIKRKDKELKVAAPLRVTTNPDDTEETLLKFYAGEENTWSINQKSGEDKVGFNISDANGASRLFIKSEDGNVGIGTTEPSAPLQVKATKTSNPTNNGLSIYNSSSGEDQHAILSVRVAGKEGGKPFISWDVEGESGWSMGIDNQDENKLKIAPDWANLTNSTLMTFDGQGHVGIGTTKPQGKLQIGPDSKGIRFRDNGGGVDIESLGADLYLNYDQNNTCMGKEGFFKVTAQKTVSIDGTTHIKKIVVDEIVIKNPNGDNKYMTIKFEPSNDTIYFYHESNKGHYMRPDGNWFHHGG
ncbi:MAG: hypothetical protein F6J92_13210 [Symploca sp. SIO1A3]|nr:hypothetical protein [Symploca sp. SIO1A3]